MLIGTKDEHGEIFWSFPKGHQENNETDIETALRETHEEIGLEVEIIDQTLIILSHLIHDGATVKDIYLFLAKTKSTKVKPQEGEVEFWKWVPCDEVDQYLADYYQAAWKEVGKRILQL